MRNVKTNDACARIRMLLRSRVCKLAQAKQDIHPFSIDVQIRYILDYLLSSCYA